MQCETLCLYLIDRIFAPEITSDGRLHLIYLINDVLHNWFDRFHVSNWFDSLFLVFVKATMIFE